MSLRSKKPQVKLRGSQLTRAQKRAMRSARQLRLSELSRAQKRAVRSAQRTAQRTAQSAQTAALSAQSAAQSAAQRLGPPAGQARQAASMGVQNARMWGAPRLDRAGAYVEEELGPRVGSMLRRTAERIEPPRPRRARRGIAATLLLAGGALGAAGAIATRRTVARKQAEEPEPAPAEHLSSVSDDDSTERARTS
ncbi:hypothetical protein NE236_20555 [Actinoallomurus purpureus]|uniref:hypothetical protein n=1 Tax=Actinoallomurus purpureus TaxID=478114 RepID=UPI002091F53E|nr:hypothetical protein [Actinoallomurus purpureus]MCO6007375.1 hypothetical protein [Actinoallomurus purpureus]